MLRVFEAFAGYGSQRMALRNLNIPHKVVGISEIEGGGTVFICCNSYRFPCVKGKT